MVRLSNRLLGYGIAKNILDLFDQQRIVLARSLTLWGCSSEPCMGVKEPVSTNLFVFIGIAE